MKKLLAILTSSAVLLTGCFGDSRPEKERFIDATVEVTCLVFSSNDLLDPQLEQQTKDIFKGYGFDVNDEEAMLEVAQRYDDDADVQAAVEAALEECAGDLLEAFSNLSEGVKDLEGTSLEVPVDGAVVEEMVVEEGADAATEEVVVEEVVVEEVTE